MLEFTFCQIQRTSLKVRKSALALLCNRRGGVSLHKRYLLSGLRFVTLLLGIQGEQHCYGSLPDSVIFKVSKSNIQKTLVSECYLIFSVGKELYPQRASAPTSMCNCSQVLMSLTQS